MKHAARGKRSGGSTPAAADPRPPAPTRAALDGSVRVQAQAQRFAAARGPVQRRVYLPFGGLDDSTPEPLALSSVLNHLRRDGIAVNAHQRAVLAHWCVDNDEHIYNGMFDLRHLMRDVDAAPPPTRTWQQGLDPHAFAWRKLLDADKDPNLLLQASRVVIHPDVDAQVQGLVLNGQSDFPVRLVQVGPAVHAVNLLGEGRRDELMSYLQAVGAPRTEVAREVPTAVVGHLGTQLAMAQWPQSFHLSVMPISILSQVDPGSAVFRWDGRRSRYPFAWLQVGQWPQATDHIVCDIRWANGVVVEHLLQAIHAHGKQLASVNLHGICGSLTPALGRGQMVAPRGRIHSLSPEHPQVLQIARNDVQVPGALFVMDHGHVTTILQENDESLAQLLDESEIHTLEMEAYHLVRGMEATGYDGTVKIVFTVSDVMTSPHENLGRPEPPTHATRLARKERNKRVIEAFGLGRTLPV